MQLSEQASNWFAFACLIAAVLAFGKVLDAFHDCIQELREKFVIVKKQEDIIGTNFHFRTFYRFGVGNECVFDAERRLVSSRYFRWERTKHGEIHEIEQ
jgi:hypothetical protein